MSPDTSTLDKLSKVEGRIQEIEYALPIKEKKEEKLRYDVSMTVIRNHAKSSSGPVYSTEDSRLFHRSGCSKLNSQEGSLILFPSHANAEKNGGKACPNVIHNIIKTITMLLSIGLAGLVFLMRSKRIKNNRWTT